MINYQPEQWWGSRQSFWLLRPIAGVLLLPCASIGQQHLQVWLYYVALFLPPSLIVGYLRAKRASCPSWPVLTSVISRNIALLMILLYKGENSDIPYHLHIIVICTILALGFAIAEIAIGIMPDKRKP